MSERERAAVTAAARGTDREFLASAFARECAARDGQGDEAAGHRRRLAVLADLHEPDIARLPYPATVLDEVRREFVRIRRDLERRPDDYYRIGNHALRCDYRILCFGRVPAGVEHFERGGIPRRLLYAAGVGQALRFLVCNLRTGGFAPFYNIHFRHGVRPAAFLLVYTEEAQRRLCLNIAGALEMNPQVRGLVATSWWYDPALATVSPHLVYLRANLESWGARAFLYRHQVGHALANSPARRALHVAGRYRPAAWTMIWPRADLLAWARTQ